MNKFKVEEDILNKGKYVVKMCDFEDCGDYYEEDVFNSNIIKENLTKAKAERIVKLLNE